MNLFRLVAGMTIAALTTLPAMAQDAAGWKPTEPVEIVVHSAAGAGNDLIAREIVAIIDKHKLADVRFQVINKTGGGTTAAINYLVENPTSTQIVALGSNAWLTESLLQEEAKHSWIDFTSIATLGEDPWIGLVKSNSLYHSLGDLVADAKAKPGAISQAGGSVAARDQLVSVKLMKETGAQWNYVAFGSRGERAAALLGGHVQLYMTDVIEASEHVRSGRARGIVALAPSRLADFPDTPTVHELYPSIPHLALVRFAVGPAQMPAEAVAYYENLLRQVSETEEWKEYTKKNGFLGEFKGAADTTAFAKQHRDAIRDVAVQAGIKVVR